MTSRRWTALGLLVVVCLAAAAPAAAGEREAGTPGALRLAGAAEWLAGWLARLMELVTPAPGGPRSVVAATGSCIDPSGTPAPCPAGEAPDGVTAQGDEGSCIDPSGNRVPCAP
jgi:hypothetical protein